jgi:hypothetical protein
VKADNACMPLKIYGAIALDIDDQSSRCPLSPPRAAVIRQTRQAGVASHRLPVTQAARQNLTDEQVCCPDADADDPRQPPDHRVGGQFRVRLVLFIRLTTRVRSLTGFSRSRLGRLASSSHVGIFARLQSRGSPRRQPRKARFSNPVSSRSVFARQGSRDTATLVGWIT